ncbi:MAG TPA: transcriptional antiterminator [Clostridiaceae bacterium]|nr:transcriptional antiterminator [Clostridiaceae bacterium]
MISRNYSIIIKYLTNKGKYVTACELSQQIGVSIRTIKRYIKDINYYINDYGVEIISLNGAGYKIGGPSKGIKRVNEEAENIIEGFEVEDSAEGRIARVICTLLSRNYITVEELSEKLNLSVPSVNILITGVKDILKAYDLKLISKPFYGSKIVGQEIKIRSLMLRYAIKTDENYSLYNRLDNIAGYEIESIQSIITKFLRNNSIIICDKDVTALLIRIIISISRMRNDCIFQNDDLKDVCKPGNYELVEKIMQQVGKAFNFAISKNEVLYVSMSCGVTIYNYNTGEELIKDSQDGVEEFVEQALQDIFMISGINFLEDEDFKNALVMHLKIFINRFRAGINAKNPLLNQIKIKFPIETDLATIIATKLKSEFKVTLNEDEIGFIAMHFGAAFERKKDKNGKKVCIICHYGIGTSRLLVEKLKQQISDIDIVGIYPVSYLDIAVKQDVDFIVSTIKLNNRYFKVQVFYIEDIFSNEIVNELNSAISVGEQRRKIIAEIFSRDVFLKVKAETGEGVIKIIGEVMKSKGFIDDEVIANVIEREKLSSTDIGHMTAIPHAIMEGAYKSIIGVGILEKPIIWNKEEVQMVFMACFNKKERYKLQIFEFLYDFIKDEGEVKRVIKDFNFEKFMRIIQN